MAKLKCPICGKRNEDNLVIFTNDGKHDPEDYYDYNYLWLREGFLICHKCYDRFVFEKHHHILREECREITFDEIDGIIKDAIRFNAKRPTREYTYKVCLCDGHFCNGRIEVMAETEEEAYAKAMDCVLTRLAKALPELGVDVYIELED